MNFPVGKCGKVVDTPTGPETKTGNFEPEIGSGKVGITGKRKPKGETPIQQGPETESGNAKRIW
jgi:hypothetical protein